LSLTHRLTTLAIMQKGLVQELREGRERFNNAETIPEIEAETQRFKETLAVFKQTINDLAKLKTEASKP